MKFPCPAGFGCRCSDISITNIISNKTINYSSIFKHMILDHGFFEDNDTYNFSPKLVIDVLELNEKTKFKESSKHYMRWCQRRSWNKNYLQVSDNNVSLDEKIYKVEAQCVGGLNGNLNSYIYNDNEKRFLIVTMKNKIQNEGAKVDYEFIERSQTTLADKERQTLKINNHSCTIIFEERKRSKIESLERMF
jgi:hypothetical protein